MTSGAARTTIVIATRNRRAELESVLMRLLDETRCPIIVMDNNSDDGTATMAQRHAARAPGRVRVVELGDNLGAVARNIGVARSTTPYVAFCDDDSWWDPGAFDRAERIFDEHPAVGLLAARTVVWPDFRDDPMVGLLSNSPLGLRPGLPGPSILGFMACAAMVRKSAFDSVGGFSTVLHFRGEEQLLAMDLAAAGWELCYCPDLVAVHRPSTARLPGPAQHARVLRNEALTAWLRRPVPVCIRKTAALVRATTGDRAYAAAALEAVRLLPEAVRQRRRLPKGLEADIRMLEEPA
jgi:GT2 family glycosyltransferase